MARPRINRNYTTDAATELASGQAVTQAATYSSPSVDLGLNVYTEGDVVLDLSSVDVAGGDETYTVTLELSDEADFAPTKIERCKLRIGDLAATSHSIDMTDDRYVLPFTNEMGGALYQFARITVLATGSSASMTIDEAFISQRR